MYLHQIVRDTFVLMHADWTVAQARLLLKRNGITHVVMVRREGHELYHYLFRRDTLRFRLSQVRPDQVSLRDALNLHETDARVADAYRDHQEINEGVVVLDEGRIIGFYDPHAPVDKGPMRGAHPPAAPAQPALVPRTLVADFPKQAQLNTTVALTVALSAEPAAGGEALPLAVTVGETLTVLVEARRGFVVQGNSLATITVTDGEQTPRQLFMLQATELGVGKVRVSAFRQGQELGSFEVAATVVAATANVDSTTQHHTQVVTPVRIQSPDLALEIREQVSNGEMSIMVYLNAVDPNLGLNWAPFGPIKLRTNPLEYFQEFFKDIEQLPLSSEDERKIAERKLGAKGSQLFAKLFPPDLQVLLWSVRNQIKSVQIQSDEPWIPWELCKLEGKENGEDVPGPFLCEAFAMTRWMPGIPIKPTLTLNRIGLVVPQNSGLAYAQAEQTYMQSLGTAQRQVESIAAKYLDLTDAMATGSYDGWHFTGHGSFRAPDPNGSGLELEDQSLRPDDLSDTSVKKLGKAKPLVFLNACQLGRSALTLTDVGGWAAQFLRTNAAAFIGAYWNVYDETASRFASEFYNRLFSGLTIGQAAQAARIAVKQNGDPTWLAYTVYAHPLAVIAE